MSHETLGGKVASVRTSGREDFTIVDLMDAGEMQMSGAPLGHIGNSAIASPDLYNPQNALSASCISLNGPSNRGKQYV